MIRNEVEVALNEVLSQCEHVARRYRHSATIASERRVAGLLNRLAAEREGAAEQLRFHLQALGDTPDASDVEIDALREVGDRISARLAASGDAALLRGREQDENRLRAVVDRALATPVPGNARDVLERVRRELAAAVEELTAAAGTAAQ